jgi:hypothetical protein
MAQLASLERVATEKGAELRKRLPLARLFRLGEPNPEGAALLGPMIARLLAATDAGAAPNHSFECRDVVCRLTIVTPTGTNTNPWWQALQRRNTDLRGHTNGMSFHVGTPTQDPVTKEGLVEEAVYFRLGTPPGATGRP